ncbi:hypothetical protein D3C86_966140 [compost metagenome]
MFAVNGVGVVKLGPVANAVPPDAEANHFNVVPPFAVAFNVVTLPEQIVFPVAETVGLG